MKQKQCALCRTGKHLFHTFRDDQEVIVVGGAKPRLEATNWDVIPKPVTLAGNKTLQKFSKALHSALK